MEKSNQQQIPPIQIKDLFAQNEKYIIPIYQRNYSWEDNEIKQLIQDIDDKKNSNKKYYLGSLVVNQTEENYKVIDGQQRLTTLFLILCAIKNISRQNYNDLNLKFKELNNIIQKDSLRFECRSFSNVALEELWKFEEDNIDSIDVKDNNIKSRYKIIYENLNFKAKNDENFENFIKYFLNNVLIFRVEVPKHTDLNKYFEIMNNRGEQLEKHEILKAKLYRMLTEDKRHRFNMIWEACSNMETYLQYGFNFSKDKNNDYSKCDRVRLFYADDKKDNNGNKESCLIKKDKFSEWLKEETTNNESEINAKKIPDIISSSFKENSNDGKEESKQKNSQGSVVNFSNFLLIVLRILSNQNKFNIDKDISLDDKKLLEEFDKYIGKDGKFVNNEAEFAEEFCWCLFKTRYLFDRYIIKRFEGKWCLRQQKWYKDNQFNNNNTFEQDENKDIIMLLAMFHVSQPSLNYKHWLNGALNYCYNAEDIDSKTYRDYLLELAERFLRCSFLAVSPKDYREIVFDEKMDITGDIDINNLNCGTGVENFIFNYLDYKLWSELRDKKELNGREKQIFDKFEFTFRSSVEHFLPRSYNCDEEIKNSFGNLCLISSSKNSEYSNKSPQEKEKNYKDLESIKQDIMMKMISDNEIWSEKQIIDHGRVMMKKLCSGFKDKEKIDKFIQRLQEKNRRI